MSRATLTTSALLAGLLACASSIGCGSDTTVAPTGCQSGDQQICTCPAGEPGVQACTEDGVFGECDCSPTSASCETQGVIHVEGIVNDAEYDLAVDLIVAGTTKPAALLLIDPTTGVAGEVDTMYSPTSVSVAPGGGLAVTGHDGRITIVDLDALQASAPIELGVNVSDVVAGATGYAYAWSQGSTTAGDAFSIRLSDGEVTMWPSGGIGNHLRGKLHPAGAAVFAAEPFGYDLMRFDVSGGPLAALTDQEIAENPPCGDVWISVEGSTLYSSCGHAHALASDAAGEHLGTLVEKGPSPWGGPQLVSVWHDELTGHVAALGRPEDEFTGDDAVPPAYRYVEFFEDAGFTSTAMLDIPCVHDDFDDDATFDARFVFGSSDGHALYVVLVSDELGESAVVRLPADD